MKLCKSLVFLTIFVLFIPVFLNLADARDDLVPGSRYTSARGAALGDASLSLGDDVASGLFYNPANLAKIRLPHFDLLNFSMNLNSPYLSNLGLGSLSLPVLSSFLSTLTTASPQFLGGGGSFLMDFGMPGFAIGLLVQTQLGGSLNSSGTLTYRSLYQLIPSLGTAFRLFRGLVRVGYSLQWVNEAVGNVTTSSVGAASYTSGIAQGSAFSHNLGIGITLPITLLPAFDLVVRNALGAPYISSVLYSFAPGTSTLPTTDAMTFDGSVTIQPHLGRGVILNLVAEYRDILNQSGDSVLGRIALGGELAFRGRIFFRGGWGGGYPAAGLGIRAGKSELSFAYYTTEIGTSYLSQGDPRFMMQYQIRGF